MLRLVVYDSYHLCDMHDGKLITCARSSALLLCIPGTVVLKQYCEKILSEGHTKIRCPDRNCSSEWEWFIVRHVLSSLYPKRCGEMEAEISENYFSHNSACKKCPGCRVWFTRLHPHIRSVRCVLCTERNQKAFEFCWSCLGSWDRKTNSCGNRTCANEE